MQQRALKNPITIKHNRWREEVNHYYLQLISNFFMLNFLIFYCCWLSSAEFEGGEPIGEKVWLSCLLACMHTCTHRHLHTCQISFLPVWWWFFFIMTGSIRVALCLSLGTPEGSQLLSSEIQQSHNICHREWYFLTLVCQLEFYVVLMISFVIFALQILNHLLICVWRDTTLESYKLGYRITVYQPENFLCAFLSAISQMESWTK